MTDLELVKACAEAMGFQYELNTDKAEYYDAVCLYDEGCNMWNKTYNPLWNDAESMELIRRFRLQIDWSSGDSVWVHSQGKGASYANGTNLNRAVVECVAKIHAAR